MRARAAAVAGLVAVVACSATAVWLTSRDRSLRRIQEAGSIRIGYAVEAPYAFLKPGGEVTGESPEVAKRTVASLGIRRVEWRQVEFDALIPELVAGRIDVIAAGMFITPERVRHVSFSEPTFHVQQGLLVPKGNPRRLHSYEQASTDATVKIAVLSGAVEETLLRGLAVPSAQLVLVPDVLTGRVAVESGLADGLALSSPTIRWMAQREQLGKTEMAEPFERPETAMTGRLGYGGFAFRKEDRQLLRAWNAALATFIGSPEHRSLAAEFGFTARELPEAMTTNGVQVR